jgi:prepilin-type N-terminal cleavage/methylation domain-containing protein
MKLRKANASIRAAARSGFTLMELLVVVAILLVLAGTSILAYRTIFAESKISIAKSECTNLKNQLEAFAMSPANMMQYPDPANGFNDLVARGYLSRVPVDPWLQPYRWNVMPIGDGSSLMAVVWSCGPNMVDENGSGDDITSE